MARSGLRHFFALLIEFFPLELVWLKDAVKNGYLRIMGCKDRRQSKNNFMRLLFRRQCYISGSGVLDKASAIVYGWLDGWRGAESRGDLPSCVIKLF